MNAFPVIQPTRPPLLEALEARTFLSATVDLADQLTRAFNVGPASVVGIGTDAQGNVYVGGRFEGTVDFNPARRRTFNLTATAPDTGDVFVAKYSPAGGLFWAVHVGHVNVIPGHQDLVAFDLATDPTGNVYLAGHFERTVDFDPGPGMFNLTADVHSAGEPFLLGLGPTGNFRHAVRLPGPSTPADAFSGDGLRVATDPPGHVYLAAGYQDHPDAGAQQHTDATLTKFTATGRTLWTRHYAGTDAGLSPFALAVDASGDAFLAGPVAGTIDFDPGPAVRSVPDGSACVLKLDAGGEFAWLGALDGATPYGLRADGAGNLFVTGGYAGAPDFNFSPRKQSNLTSAGGQDAFVARYSAAGALAWARSMGGGGSDGANSVSIAADGTVYVLGEFAGRAYFNPGRSRFKLTTPAAYATFVAAFSPAGAFANAWQIDPYANQLAPLPSGGLVIGGLLQAAGDVDPGPGVLTLRPTVTGKSDLFLIDLR